MRRFGCGSMVVGLLWAFAVPASSAQQRATDPPAAATRDTAAAPAVIGVTDVIPSGERALTRLRDIRKTLDADNSVSVVEASLPEFAQKSDEWWNAEEATIQQLNSVQRLNDVAWQLHVYEGQIADWNKLLTASTRKWSSSEQTLKRLIADWQATQMALDRAAPQAVANKIVEVLNEGDAARRQLQLKTAQLVAVQGKLTERSRRLNAISAEIDSARQNSTVDLLSKDSPTLWTAFFADRANQPTSTLIRDSQVKIRRDGAGFFQLYRKHLLVHLLLFLVLVAVFYRLRLLPAKPGEVMPAASERFILHHSIASALLVGLLCVPLLYSDVSPHMMRLILIPAIIPILLFFPVIFSPRLRISFYLLTAIYVVDFWRYYLPPQWLFVRILLLIESLMGIGLVYLIMRVKKIEPPLSPFAGNIIRFTLKAAMVLFFGAIVANLLGNQTLAEILFSPLVRTIFLGVVIRTAAVVMTTFALVALHTPLLLLLRTVQQHGDTVAAKIRKLANYSAAGLWVIIALYNVGALGTVVKALEDSIDSEWKLGAVEISVRDLGTFILVLWAAFLLSRMLRFILVKEIFPRFELPRGVPDALELMARYGVLLFGFIFALTSAGANLSQLMLALSALGVGIGFGLQNIVNNFVCGLILVFEHPIQVGDFVEVGPHFGQVHRIGFRSSSLSTFDGGNVIIPNSELIGTRVMNWSLSNQLRRITLRVPVPIGTDPGRVFDIFKSIARSQPNVVTIPAPSTALEKLGDSSLTFILRCWTRTESYEAVCFGLTLAINNTFKEAGIQIPFPQTDVHVHLPEKAAIAVPQVEKKK